MMDMCIFCSCQPSSRQCEHADEIMGKGDLTKGHAAMKGVSIPMFTAKGMGVKRANGEVSQG